MRWVSILLYSVLAYDETVERVLSSARDSTHFKMRSLIRNRLLLHHLDILRVVQLL